MVFLFPKYTVTLSIALWSTCTCYATPDSTEGVVAASSEAVRKRPGWRTPPKSALFLIMQATKAGLPMTEVRVYRNALHQYICIVCVLCVHTFCSHLYIRPHQPLGWVLRVQFSVST